MVFASRCPRTRYAAMLKYAFALLSSRVSSTSAAKSSKNAVTCKTSFFACGEAKVSGLCSLIAFIDGVRDGFCVFVSKMDVFALGIADLSEIVQFADLNICY